MKIGKANIDLYRTPGYNNPEKNERTIELALALYFKSKVESIVELGAVLPYYIEASHPVYDLNDPYANCIRLDLEHINNYSLKDQNVISVSTIEHIGFDDYSTIGGHQSKANWANGMAIIHKVMQEANHYLLTIPVGYNRALDEKIRILKNVVLAQRINEENDWNETDSWNHKYNSPFPAANGICIITNFDDFIGG